MPKDIQMRRSWSVFQSIASGYNVVQEMMLLEMVGLLLYTIIVGADLPCFKQ